MRLGNEYTVVSQGYMDDREDCIKGRYIDKVVDITIKKDNKAIAGIAVKFVMQNYAQNSNNYFENMLGETANIRSNNIPYFQIFIIIDKLPYYNRDKRITRWETFSEHHIAKYVMLSKDNTDICFHTPNKTLIYVVHLPECNNDVETAHDYIDYYRKNPYDVTLTNNRYEAMGSAVILNDYEKFITKVYHTILSL